MQEQLPFFTFKDLLLANDKRHAAVQKISMHKKAMQSWDYLCVTVKPGGAEYGNTA